MARMLEHFKQRIYHVIRYKEVMLPCWNRLPEKRPMFQEITDDLERLFHGAQDGEMYYDDAPRNGQQDLYDGTLPSTYR